MVIKFGVFLQFVMQIVQLIYGISDENLWNVKMTLLYSFDIFKFIKILTSAMSKVMMVKGIF